MITNIEIRALKPAAKPFKRSDELGLFILVRPSGSFLSRFKYRFLGFERSLSLGKYPIVGLKQAREERDQARAMLAEGVDPIADKQKILHASIAAATTFSVVVDEYIEKMEREGKAPATIKKARWLRNQLNAAIGCRPVAMVTPHELLGTLRVERRGHHETAQRPRAFAGSIFRYAISTLRGRPQSRRRIAGGVDCSSSKAPRRNSRSGHGRRTVARHAR